MSSPATREPEQIHRILSGREQLRASYAKARHNARRHLGAEKEAQWAHIHGALYDVNAGPALMKALWGFEARILPRADLADLRRAGASARTLCRHAGAARARAAIEEAAALTPLGASAEASLEWLETLAFASAEASDVVEPLVSGAARLCADLDAAGLRAFVEDGLRLYPQDKARRLAYFRLVDPLALNRLAHHAGQTRFAPHEARLVHLTRALFGFELAVQMQAPEMLAERSRLAGGLLLMPLTHRGLSREEAPAFYEAAILHAAAHRRFTLDRFAAGRLKPMQMALVCLLEDARVERLAARDYPGLARLWRRFHTMPASRAQTVASLFARLARALADPDFEDADAWVRKGRGLFEEAFSRTGGAQSIVRPLAGILGHDLGQLRIPFDGKAYRVEPAYRDDGLGLFDAPETDRDAQEPLPLEVEGVRMETREEDSAGRSPPPQTESGRLKPQSAGAEEGRLLAHYGEWDHRLAALQPEHVAVREYDPTGAASGRLAARLGENAGLVERVAALVTRSRLGRAERLKRRLDGDEIDIDAAQEALLSLRMNETPDPRIHALKRRQGRDTSLLLLVDSSQSTADPVGRAGETVLSMAALATAILGEALGRAGDPFGAFAFASNGREDVRVVPLKAFTEDANALVARLDTLRPAFSTRLGAALRHGTVLLEPRVSHRRIMIVITDGEPADVDVETPGYLSEDARHAVAAARGRGLDVFCVALGAQADGASAGIFGRRNTLCVERIEDLPGQLATLYFQLTVR